ncbi:hypothetical protein [Pseudonocardia sp. ICBG601]|uniref:hypothetical protein n=1 Tax=Pseudonocardia sp. ICBG601 TaxID=2846759 RepID=UPI001CF670CB|nr:hypothetical protein [Pseudonocardia sp. ICBG601]
MTTDSILRPPAGVTTGPHVAELVDRYRARFDWYRDMLDTAGAHRTGRLADLPLLDSEILTRHYYGDTREVPGTHAFFTSGTSGGARKQILYCEQDDADYIAHRGDLFTKFLTGIAPDEVAVADLGTGHAAASARQIFTDLGLQARDIDFRAPLPEHLERLSEWQPAVLFTMPMILDRIMAALPEPDFRPRKIMVVGDVAPAAWRAGVAHWFGISPNDVMDVFGSIEIGAIGYSCAETGLYHFHDHIVAEVVSPDTVVPGASPRPPGDGLLLLTSTARRQFPALRYVTGDLVAGLRTIRRYGRDVQVFDRIEGRITSDYKHGERLSGHDLTHVMATVFPGRPFEAMDDGHLRIRVAGDPVTDEEQRALRAAVADVAPDVATMVDSGLVRPIEVEAVHATDLRSGHGKRRFDLANT